MKYLISIIILLAFATNGSTEIYWDQPFGGIGQEEGYSIDVCNDKGYIITGKINSYGGDDYDVWLLKTDEFGNKLWDKTFGWANEDEGKSVQQTMDGGYIIIGSSIRENNKSFNVLLIKTDEFGNKQWDKTFSGLYYSYFPLSPSGQQTSDGGYIVTGYNGRVWLIKTDADGNMQWDQKFDEPGCYDHGNSVQQTTDGGYIIAGVIEPYISENSDVWLIKTDAFGNLQWDQTYGGEYSDVGESVQQTTDGGFIITGWTRSYGVNHQGDVWLIKTDPFGNLQWDQTFGESLNDYGYSVQQTTDGGYVITGMLFSYWPTYYDLYLIKTDDTGNKEWDKILGGYCGESGYSVKQTEEESYIIVGYTGSFGYHWWLGYSWNVWLIYYNPDGEDTIPPSTVTDLIASPSYEDPYCQRCIKLTWTAPGDNGNIYRATEYDFRYSTKEITTENWDSAIPLEDEPPPNSSGFTETLFVEMPHSNYLYFFAMKSIDEAGNISEISNCASDYSTPVVLSSFEGSYNENGVLLTWVTESEKNNLGWNIYRGENPRVGFTKINQELIPGACNSSTPQYYNYLDETIMPEMTYYYYLENIDLNGKTYNSWVITIRTNHR